MVALQLLRYMVRFWEERLKKKRPLVPIIPLVVYHGEKSWTIPTDFFTLLGAPESIRAYSPDFHYQLNDFSHISDEEIRGEIWLRVCLSVMRATYSPRLRHELWPLVKLIFELLEQDTGIEYIRTIMYYLTKGSEKVSRAEMEQALLEQGAQGEKIMATIAQDYIQQGMQQGLQQGRLEEKRNIARQLLKLHGIVTVSEITGLSVAEVQALAASEAESDED